MGGGSGESGAGNEGEAPYKLHICTFSFVRATTGRNERVGEMDRGRMRDGVDDTPTALLRTFLLFRRTDLVL